MAYFSSKGPNTLTPEIIKPDITAPGVNIVAAYPHILNPDNSPYGVMSGTSMATPHVSGAAAIVKSVHPHWSPAAIKSALMTTATVLDNTGSPILSNGNPATPFDYGSGHINPNAALDPGLVYDFDSNGAINYLCSFGLDPSRISQLANEPVTCPNPAVPSYNLNYPSIAVPNMNGVVRVQRTVTSYDSGREVYNARVDAPAGTDVQVIPSRLVFREPGRTHTFTVEITP